MPSSGSAPAGTLLHVHVQPRASRTEVRGMHDGAVKVRLRAPPVDGAANDELVRFLAERLGVARRDITIVAGATGRRKTVRVTGTPASTADLAARLTAPAP